LGEYTRAYVIPFYKRAKILDGRSTEIPWKERKKNFGPSHFTSLGLSIHIGKTDYSPEKVLPDEREAKVFVQDSDPELRRKTLTTVSLTKE